jgi:hypothetical protein
VKRTGDLSEGLVVEGEVVECGWFD